MSNKIKDEAKEQLLKAQESKMEAVVIYRYLSGRAKDPELKNALLKISSDEGKHAGVLRKMSGKTIVRKEKPALRFRMMARVFGVKMMMRMMLTSEQKNADAFVPVAKANPAMREILNDERRHCRILQQFIDKK